MAKFNLDHNVKHPTDKTFETIEKALKDGSILQKYDPKIQCSFDKATKSGKINGSQFKADLKVVPNGDGSKITVSVDLPLLLMPFKGKISESLVRLFEKHLG